MRLTFAAVAALVLATVATPVAGAQGGTQSVPRPEAQAPAPAPPPEGAFTAGQIQKWFEAFTVLQAQDALQLSEAQYGRFVTRLKALQDTRRQHQQARNRILVDIRRLLNHEAGSGDEPAITDRLKALREEDDRAAAELRKAYDAVDETLDLRQQARFRLFEERMEQQKIELLLRARQNARPGARGR
jgi:hypothetical protein